jgi:hypothetical protein
MLGSFAVKARGGARNLLVLTGWRDIAAPLVA